MARKIEVKIIGNADSLSRAFGKASQSGSKFGAMMGKTAKLAGLGLVAMGGAAGAAGIKMVSLASDAAEVQSKLEVVFGKSLPGLTKNIDTFSKATGASKFAMREQAADMGALLAPMLGSKKGAADMSLQFTKLATDLGSFNNIPVANALEKIRAGLVGESEPLRSLGVLLTEATTKEFAYANGIAKRGAVLTEVQKVEARAGQIMAQTTLAQGDAIRTADSLANQWKRLKNGLTDFATEGGRLLAPFATQVVSAMNTALGAVSGFADRLGKAQGLHAKIDVVLDSGQKFAASALKIGMDAGKVIGDALGKVDWAATGNKIAAGIGEAFRKGIPALAKFAETITTGFTKAMRDADWQTIGAEIGKGLKEGATPGIEKFHKGLKQRYKDEFERFKSDWAAGGRAMGNALSFGLFSSTKEELPKSTALVPKLMKAGIDPAIAVAVGGGRRIGSGLAGGLTAALSGVGASVANTIIWQLNSTELQLKQKYGIHSPSTVWAERIGKPLGEGIVMGMDGGLALLAPKMVSKIQTAVARAQAVVAGARTRMQASFSLLSDKLLRAFDADTGGTKTPAEAALASISDRRQQEDLQSALADALAGGDATAIARAQEDIAVAGLERQAAAERQAWDDQRGAMRENLEGRLSTLAAHYGKEGATVKGALSGIDKIMRTFGITFAESGLFIGNAFVAGLQSAIGGAAAGAAGVRGAQTGGNAKPNAASVVFSFPNYVGDKNELMQVVRAETAKYNRANGAFAI